MKVRRAEERDIPRIAELLLQVAKVHADGRPDLFKAGQRKYTDEELKAILRDTAPYAVARRLFFFAWRRSSVSHPSLCTFTRLRRGAPLIAMSARSAPVGAG